MVSTNYIPNYAYFLLFATLYLSSNRFCSNVSTNCFCTPFPDLKIENAQQEKYLHIVQNMYSRLIQTM